MASPVEVPPQVQVPGPSFIRQLALTGIIGPPLFILFTIVEDILQDRFLVRTGNDPLVVSPMSINALGPTGWLQILTFILFGLSIIALALGLHRGVQEGRWSKIGIGLLIAVGVTMVLFFNSFLDSHDGFYMWFLLVPLAWLEVVALRLWKVSARSHLCLSAESRCGLRLRSWSHGHGRRGERVPLSPRRAFSSRCREVLTSSLSETEKLGTVTCMECL